MKSSSSCCSRGSSPLLRLRRDRRISSPTLIPCTSADAFCTGRQKLCLIFTPASSMASSVPVKMRSACSNCPRSRSAASVNTRSIFCACPRAKYTMCDASFTMLEIFGCVSSRRICTRVSMGPTRECKSPTRLFTFSVVRRSRKNNAVRITTCTTRAIAATILQHSSQNCIPASPAPLRDGTSCYPFTAPLGLRFAQIRFPSGFHCRRDGIFFAHRNFLATLDQLICALTQFAGLLLRVIFALIRLLRQKIACLFSGFRRKQDSDQRSNSQPYQEISHLGTHIVRHSILHRNRSIAVVSTQHTLTAISTGNWLRHVRSAKLAKYFLSTFP